MSMSLGTRRELYKLRELVHFLLVGKTCHFCGESLSPTAEDFDAHGNAVGPKFLDKLSIHHKDGDHNNNSHDNKTLCHRSCHKSHHRRAANKAKGLKPVDLDAPLGEY